MNAKPTHSHRLAPWLWQALATVSRVSKLARRRTLMGAAQSWARRSSALTWLASSCVMGVASCDGSRPLVYTAQAYQAEAGCLEGYAPLGLVQGEDLGANCEAVCLLLGEQLYVSTVCPPYPTSAELLGPQDSPECAAALQAVANESSCDDDPDAGQ